MTSPVDELAFNIIVKLLQGQGRAFLSGTESLWTAQIVRSLLEQVSQNWQMLTDPPL